MSDSFKLFKKTLGQVGQLGQTGNHAGLNHFLGWSRTGAGLGQLGQLPQLPQRCPKPLVRV